METLSRRFFTRKDCHIPIKYAAADKTDYRQAILYNSSKTGVYFEAAEAPEPGVNVQIVRPGAAASAFEPEAIRFYEGRTVWCRRLADETDSRCGCGVQLFKCGHRLDGAEAQLIQQNCDLCNEPTPCHELFKTSEFFYLCPACHRFLKLLPDGHLKNSIKRFLIGNVL
jgi:hypothetical protein